MQCGGQTWTSARKRTSNLQSLADHPFVISVCDIYIVSIISLFHENIFNVANFILVVPMGILILEGGLHRI